MYDSPDSTRRREVDPEKAPFRRQDSFDYEEDDEESPPSSYSSRVTSASHQPILSNAFVHPPKNKSLYRLPNSKVRWICLGLLGSIVIFILTLIRMSFASSKQVEMNIGKETAPKPAAWESFPFLERYYGGVRSLVLKASNDPEYPGEDGGLLAEVSNQTIAERALTDSAFSSSPFNPYPSYSSAEYISKHGRMSECFLDSAGTVRVPLVHSYFGVPRGMPDPVMGSNALLGMRDDICFDRFGRLGPYGLGYGLGRGGSGAATTGDLDGAEDVWKDHPEVDFRTVKWAEAQQRCASANKNRFVERPAPRVDHLTSVSVGSLDRREEPSTDTIATDSPGTTASSSTPETGERGKLPRTAVVIRTWWDFQYTAEDLMYLRAIISELSLLSGGEYIVHFLVHVKDDNMPIWSDDATYDQVLRDSLPEEFRGMGTLWSERQMFLVYGGLEESWARGLPVHGVYRSTFMPIQYFAYQHPGYDFFWNWEMDIRYTGHFYHLFDSISKWAAQQPRKGLWERNSRFYVPSIHGTWDEFKTMVRVQTEQGTQSSNNLWSGLKAGGAGSSTRPMRQGDKPIWGPEASEDDELETDADVTPPTSYEKDKYTWGVSEDADLITFNPIFDPDGTTWLLADDVTGYNRTCGLPPRRAAIITASRLSRRLLIAMHRDTALRHHTMFSEMWPASCALQHGFKAVYAPHAEYIDRRWPTTYLEAVFNGGRNGATGGSRTSVFGDREHNFRGTTWYYNAGFPEVLWHRWLGYKFNNAGGEEVELAGEGRMCLPAMLLHPVKNVHMVVEGLRDP